MSGYIKINRKILEWEWYRNINTKVLFLHCLLKANWKDGKFEGKVIPKGSFVTSIPHLSEETLLTVREVRTAIGHLKMTGELTVETTNKYSIITVNNYCLYQCTDTQNGSQETVNSQSSDSQVTVSRHSNDILTTTIEEGKNIRRKEGKKEKRKEDILTVSKETVCRTDVQRIIEAWNALSDIGIKQVSRIAGGSKRYDSLVARIKEYGVENVLSAIDKIRASDFLQGKNKQGWAIKFDWFVLPNNFPKVLEGNYDNGNREHSGGYQSQTAQMLESSYDMMANWAERKSKEEQNERE